ncbi:hypothetical protein AX769_02340 [Frondihabitans sp. PAMC 28766]|nr:hypothetical protein AX769_02340 [Frondihabitans sp. PAMC 28766]
MLVAGVVVYALTLQWVYATLVSPEFAYIGYFYSTPPWFVTTFCIAATSAVALLLPRTITRVSHVIVWVLLVVCVAPAMLMAPYTGYLTSGQAILVSTTVGASFAIVALGVRTAPSRLGAPKGLRPAFVWAAIAVYSAVTYTLMTATLGLSLRFVQLSEVYDVRDEYKDDIAGSGALAYMISPQANIINPYLIAHGLINRKWWLVLVGVFGQYLIYSASGFKTVLFATPAILLIAFLFRSRRVPAAHSFVFGSVALMAASAAADLAQGNSTLTSLFSRRFLLTPGLLTSVYAKFFGENPQSHLSHSVLHWWTSSPYDTAPALTVGQFMRPGSKLAANANIFADGFANFGYAGFVGVGVLLLVFLRVLDHVSRGLPLGLAAMVMVMPSITLSNTAILTSLLSHGLAAGVVLLAIIPRPPSAEGHVPDAEARPAEPVRSPIGSPS